MFLYCHIGTDRASLTKFCRYTEKNYVEKSRIMLDQLLASNYYLISIYRSKKEFLDIYGDL